MGLYRAYLDDSGNPNEHSFLTIAGYVADVDGWRHFERRWAGVLRKYNAPYMHMKEFGDPKGLFQHIKQDKIKEADFIAALVEVIYESAIFCTQTTISVPAFNEFTRHHNLDLDPYSLAIYGCMMMIGRNFRNDQIELVVDKFGKATTRTAEAAEYLETHVGDEVKPTIFKTINLKDDESFKTVLPLQAADVVAWEIRKACEDRKPWLLSLGEMDYGAEHLRESYSKWAEAHVAKEGNPPRERKSFLSLRESPVLAPQGVVLSPRNLEFLLGCHPNGWRTGG